MLSTAPFHRRFRPKSITKQVPNHKLVLFGLGSQQYAIHIEYVQSILHEFTIEAVLEQGYGLVHFNQQIITVFNLARLFGCPDLPEHPRYLIVCRTTAGELIGFPVVHIPSIVEVSEAELGPIPAAYHRQMASTAMTQIITLPNQATVFYLDLQELLQTHTLPKLP